MGFMVEVCFKGLLEQSRLTMMLYKDFYMQNEVNDVTLQ